MPRSSAFLPCVLRLAPVVLLLAVLPARAQNGDRTGDLAFLRIGTNAAAAAMGDAHVAHSRDAHATYWNPAGLAAARTNSLALSYRSWVANVPTYGMAARFGAGAHGGVGLFITATGTDDLEARDAPGPADGTFDVQYLATGLSYGRAFGPLRAGATVKYLNERLYSETASGYGIDLGVQADLLHGGLQLGAAFQNLGEMNELSAEASELPRLLRAGTTFFPFRILSLDDARALVGTMVSAEVVHVLPTETTQLHLGAGVQLFDMLDFRAGYITNDVLRRFTFGLGIAYEGFQFDYAMLPFQNDFQGPGHLLTLTYDW